MKPLLLLLALLSPLTVQADPRDVRDPRPTIHIRTLRTLPTEITTPGRYTLSENLTIPGASTAITITADDVILDLAGCTINGEGNSSSTSIGIKITGSNVTVTNGTIRKFNYGLLAQGTNTLNLAPKLQALRILDCGFIGISLELAHGTLIEHCEILGAGNPTTSTATGILLTGNGCTIQRNRLQIHGAGIEVTPGPNANGGLSALLMANTIIATTTGITFKPGSRGTYLNNIVVGASIPYTGGTDSGGNL